MSRLIQAALAYVLVAAAAAWVVWSTLLPRTFRAKLRSRFRRSG